MNGWSGRERGAAVVDFVFVTVLIITLFLVIFQVGAALHVRNVLVATAAEGARFGANADRTPEEGAERAQEILREAIGESASSRLPCTGREITQAGNVVVEVTCAGRLPLVFLPTPGGLLHLTVRGHAFEESR